MQTLKKVRKKDIVSRAQSVLPKRKEEAAQDGGRYIHYESEHNLITGSKTRLPQ